MSQMMAKIGSLVWSLAYFVLPLLLLLWSLDSCEYKNVLCFNSEFIYSLRKNMMFNIVQFFPYHPTCKNALCLEYCSNFGQMPCWHHQWLCLIVFNRNWTRNMLGLIYTHTNIRCELFVQMFAEWFSPACLHWCEREHSRERMFAVVRAVIGCLHKLFANKSN